jgi:hypothetical protein
MYCFLSMKIYLKNLEKVNGTNSIKGWEPLVLGMINRAGG